MVVAVNVLGALGTCEYCSTASGSSAIVSPCRDEDITTRPAAEDAIICRGRAATPTKARLTHTDPTNRNMERTAAAVRLVLLFVLLLLFMLFAFCFHSPSGRETTKKIHGTEVKAAGVENQKRRNFTLAPHGRVDETKGAQPALSSTRVR